MIPLSFPEIKGNEWKYVKDCLDTGWVSSSSSYVTKLERMIADFVGCKHAIACVNGTSGLHLTMHMLDVKLGDHLIVPNITFIASANAASYTYADPIFMDVDPATWQMDLDLLEEFLTTETEVRANITFLKSTGKPIKAIMPVHVLGNLCNMPRLVDICKPYNITVVEDASESLGSYYDNRHAGSFGKLGVFSFNTNKIITTGGGGMIVTDDDELAKRTKHLTTQAKADPNTYFHDEIGFNYRMVGVLAAIGVAQMEQLSSFVKKKRFIDAYYREQLAGLGDICFQKVEELVSPNCWLFTFSTSHQTSLLSALKAADMIARPFWIPMNQLPMFQDNLYFNHHDYSRKVHADGISIPCSVGITEEELIQVVKVIKSCF